MPQPVTTRNRGELQIIAMGIGAPTGTCSRCGEFGIRWDGGMAGQNFMIHEIGRDWPHNIGWVCDLNTGNKAIYDPSVSRWVQVGVPSKPKSACRCDVSIGPCICGEFEKEYAKLHGKRQLNRLQTLRGKH